MIYILTHDVEGLNSITEHSEHLMFLQDFMVFDFFLEKYELCYD